MNVRSLTQCPAPAGGVVLGSIRARGIADFANSALRVTHSASCTANWDFDFCPCQVDFPYKESEPEKQKEKPPKYDPGRARQMWQPEALQATARPRKRPSRQVEFNQVSRLRPVRPRYMSRK